MSVPLSPPTASSGTQLPSDRQHTGQSSELGQPQAKRRLELEAFDPQYLKDVGSTSEAKRPAASLSHRAAQTSKSPSRSRYDTSLGRFTRRFVQMIGHSTDGVVDLNLAAKELNIQKRRLYDITNVLEGIQVIKKKSKSKIQWMACPLTVDSIKELQDLSDEEKKLDERLQSCTRQIHQMSEDRHSRRFAYLTYEDVKKIPGLKEQTVIVIKAPAETRLEVPHPEESHQIHLSSTQGPIEVFLCSDDPLPADAVNTFVANGYHGSHSYSSANRKDWALSGINESSSSSASSSTSFVKISAQDGANHSSGSNGFSSPPAGQTPRSPPVAVVPVSPSPAPLASPRRPSEDQQTFVTLTPPRALSLGDYLLVEDEGITDHFFVDGDQLALDMPLI